MSRAVHGAAVAGALLLGVTAASAKDITIGVSFDKIEPFRVAQQKAIEDAIAAAGVKEKFANADKDAQRQASQVDSFVSQGVSAIVSTPETPTRSTGTSSRQSSRRPLVTSTE